MSAQGVEQRTRATFVMEQHLGHLTYYRNLRAAIDADDRLDASWVEVDYDHPRGPGRVGSLHPRLRGPLSGRRQVVDGLRASDPEVAFFNTQVPAVLAPLVTRRTPYVLATDITPRQYDGMAEHYGHEVDRFRAVAAAKHAVNARVFRGAARVVCWSTWCASSITEHYGVAPERVEVVAPGVDLSLWAPGASGRDGRLRILFVGGDLDRKGGRVVIDAFTSLPPGRAELHLVTRTPYEPVDDGIVVHRDLQPNSPELIALYQSCDVFVLPSRAEAFGIAAVEASACGLPLIASRSGGLTDIVVDGVTGYSLPTVDAASIAAALERLLARDDGGRELGEGARRRAEERFDAVRNGRRLADLLIDVAGASRRR